MCNCRSWVRIPDIETNDGLYPLPDHHYNCEDFKQEMFTLVKHGEARCIMEINEAAQLVSESDEYYELSNVLLTREQFEKLSEFTGF